MLQLTIWATKYFPLRNVCIGFFRPNYQMLGFAAFRNLSWQRLLRMRQLNLLKSSRFKVYLSLLQQRREDQVSSLPEQTKYVP